MLSYRGYLIVPGWNASTGVAHFSVLRADAVGGSNAHVFQDVLDGHFSTEEATTAAAFEAGRKYIDERHAWGGPKRQSDSHLDR